MTRLGEFSPIERLFSLASLSEVTEAAQIIGLLFSTLPVMYYFDRKNRLGYILGDLIANSCCHPESTESISAVSLKNLFQPEKAAFIALTPRVAKWRANNNSDT
jgi:ATP sulfurylase